MTADIDRAGREPVTISLGEALDKGSMREAVVAAMSKITYFNGTEPEVLAEGAVKVDGTNRMSFEGALAEAGLVATVSDDVLSVVRGPELQSYDESPGAAPDEFSRPGRVIHET